MVCPGVFMHVYGPIIINSHPCLSLFISLNTHLYAHRYSTARARTATLFSAAIPKVVKMDTVGQLRHANIDTGYASRGHADKFIHLRDQLNAMAR